MTQHHCRHCQSPLQHTVIDLGHQPPSNAYLTLEQLSLPEVTYPLRVFVCTECWLVQLPAHAAADELFTSDYAYFSSTSTSWLAHARSYFNLVERLFNLNPFSHVVEIGSNDGYLLRNFLDAGIPCLGIEPTGSTAAVAESIGIPVVREFFGKNVAKRLFSEGLGADLFIGNNVFAHVPDIDDFTSGIAEMLKPEGVVTLEFPHLMQILRHTQFDTIYHEHFSYLSLGFVERIFLASGLRIWDVEELKTHGGSLRIYGCHENAKWATTERVDQILAMEQVDGLERLETFTAFQSSADRVKNDLLSFLIDQKRTGKHVAAYGAAAKGNTLLNYAGVKPDLLHFVSDAAVAKQGRYLPGSHLPIRDPKELRLKPPDWILILPWNIAPEVLLGLQDLSERGSRFVTAVPELRELQPVK